VARSASLVLTSTKLLRGVRGPRIVSPSSVYVAAAAASWRDELVRPMEGTTQARQEQANNNSDRDKQIAVMVVMSTEDREATSYVQYQVQYSIKCIAVQCMVTVRSVGAHVRTLPYQPFHNQKYCRISTS
jgi:hypothetical protein